MPAARSSSAWRSGVVATRRPPTPRQPGSRPVSSPSRAYSSVEYMIIRVWLIVERSWPTNPAECQVVPSLSSCCSSSTTSSQPARPRW